MSAHRPEYAALIPSARLRSIWRSRWKAMLRRCQDPSHPNYKDYGARGITVCPQWQTLLGFYQGVVKMVGWDAVETVTLLMDRRDNDRGYSPDNVFLVGYCVSAQNRRTKTLSPVSYTGRGRDGWAHDGTSRLDGDHRARLFRYKIHRDGDVRWVRTQGMPFYGFTKC